MLESFRGADLAWNDDDVTTSGCHPSFSLAHHGDDDRAPRAAFAAFRDPAPRPARPAHAGPPRIGSVVTHPHEGSFIRCNAGLLARLTPGRFVVFVFGSVLGLEALQRAIRHPDVRFVAFHDCPRPAAERIAAMPMVTLPGPSNAGRYPPRLARSTEAPAVPVSPGGLSGRDEGPLARAQERSDRGTVPAGARLPFRAPCAPKTCSDGRSCLPHPSPLTPH